MGTDDVHVWHGEVKVSLLTGIILIRHLLECDERCFEKTCPVRERATAYVKAADTPAPSGRTDA